MIYQFHHSTLQPYSEIMSQQTESELSRLPPVTTLFNIAVRGMLELSELMGDKLPSSNIITGASELRVRSSNNGQIDKLPSIRELFGDIKAFLRPTSTFDDCLPRESFAENMLRLLTLPKPIPTSSQLHSPIPRQRSGFTPRSSLGAALNQPYTIGEEGSHASGPFTSGISAAKLPPSIPRDVSQHVDRRTVEKRNESDSVIEQVFQWLRKPPVHRVTAWNAHTAVIASIAGDTSNGIRRVCGGASGSNLATSKMV